MSSKRQSLRITRGGQKYWLSRRADRSSPHWHITWYDDRKRQTRRRSTGATELSKAEEALDNFIRDQEAPRDAQPQDILLADVLNQYNVSHAKKLPSADQAARAIILWLDYFDGATVADVTGDAVDQFIESLRAQDYSEGYISRVLSVGRSAINKAWKYGRLKFAPFIKDNQTAADKRDAEPRGRPLTIDECVLLFQKATTPHAWGFHIVSITTMARPDAVMDLTKFQANWEYGRVNLNPPGRKQTKKYRPIVPIARALSPWLKAAPGPVVHYHGNRISSIKTMWRNLRDEAGLDTAVNPYSWRHTLGRHLRWKRVPADQISIMLGHTPIDVKRTDLIYSPYDPDYCRDAIATIDDFCDVLATRIGKALVPANAPSILPPHMRKRVPAYQLRASGDFSVVEAFRDGEQELPSVQELGVVGAAGIEPATPTMST